METSGAPVNLKKILHNGLQLVWGTAHRVVRVGTVMKNLLRNDDKSTGLENP
jgi:hypothetical protein